MQDRFIIVLDPSFGGFREFPAPGLEQLIEIEIENKIVHVFRPGTTKIH